MMSEDPDVKLAGLSLWALSYQFPESADYWDGNWLRVQIVLEARRCHIEVNGSFLRTDELLSFADQLRHLNDDLKGDATLECMEPTLNCRVSCKPRGHIEVTVNLTPDHLSQSHQVHFEIDQSYLGTLLQDCSRLLTRFPVRGVP